MYQKVLVPLDGSPLAECVLPHLDSLAKGCSVKEVDFLRVIEPVHMPTGGEGYYVDDRQIQKIEASNHAEAEQYLTALVKKSQYANVKVTWHIQDGKPATVIADYATKNNADLILIATHGRSGMSRWLWGSVADRVLRSACVPIFLIRAPGCVAGIEK